MQIEYNLVDLSVATVFTDTIEFLQFVLYWNKAGS